MSTTATNHTEHYELSQYTEDDHPTYTGDYNGDMAKIDSAIHAASQSGGLPAVAHNGIVWGNWVKFVTNSEYDTLASRVTALERALPPSAPQTTGLTAKELDT